MMASVRPDIDDRRLLQLVVQRFKGGSLLGHAEEVFGEGVQLLLVRRDFGLWHDGDNGCGALPGDPPDQEFSLQILRFIVFGECLETGDRFDQGDGPGVGHVDGGQLEGQMGWIRGSLEGFRKEKLKITNPTFSSWSNIWNASSFMHVSFTSSSIAGGWESIWSKELAEIHEIRWEMRELI